MWWGDDVSAFGLHRYAASIDDPVDLDKDGFLRSGGSSASMPVAQLPALSRSFAQRPLPA